MQITHLGLSNFRNYRHLDLPLPAGPVLLHGSNAQGKTNLLESIYYLATSKSPNASNDHQLLNWYTSDSKDPVVVARLTASVQLTQDKRPRRLEVRIIRDSTSQNGATVRREVLVNGVRVRLMDLLGNLNVVLFLPRDVALVTAAPAERRRYLDIALCQIDRHYCRSLAQYNRVLLQRNALLRALQGTRGRAVELEPWDHKLTELGGLLMVRRAQLVTGLEQRAGRIHFEELTGGSESLRLIYQPRLQPDGLAGRSTLPQPALNDPSAWLLDEPTRDVVAALREVLQASRRLELQRALSLAGPHRDDVRFLVNGRDLAEYGSRGQQRTAVFALKLAEVSWMEAQTGERPVLLLDEVLAELDHERRAYLLRCVGTADQSFLTTTDPGMFTDDFLALARRLQVLDGQISAAESEPSVLPPAQGRVQSMIETSAAQES